MKNNICDKTIVFKFKSINRDSELYQCRIVSFSERLTDGSVGRTGHEPPATSHEPRANFCLHYIVHITKSYSILTRKPRISVPLVHVSLVPIARSYRSAASVTGRRIRVVANRIVESILKSIMKLI